SVSSLSTGSHGTKRSLHRRTASRSAALTESKSPTAMAGRMPFSTRKTAPRSAPIHTSSGRASARAHGPSRPPVTILTRFMCTDSFWSACSHFNNFCDGNERMAGSRRIRVDRRSGKEQTRMDERLLIDRAKRGDNEALASLLEAQYPFLYRYLLKITLN